MSKLLLGAISDYVSWPACSKLTTSLNSNMYSGITQTKRLTAKRRSHLRRRKLMKATRRMCPPLATTKTQMRINRLKLLTFHQLIKVALFMGVDIRRFSKAIVVLYSYMYLSNSPIVIFPSFKCNKRLHISQSVRIGYNIFRDVL